jgi:hypothetical protein
MPSRPRVLIAGTEIAIATCERLIGDAAEVVEARSLGEALERIDPTVTLIISSVRFDESRMFDFLNALEARRDRCRAAVICCRIVREPLSNALYGAIETAARALGVKAFFDLDTEVRNHGQEAAERKLAELIFAHLGTPFLAGGNPVFQGFRGT